IVRLKPAPPSERSYRVVVDELPGSGPTAGTTRVAQGLRFVFRYSIPLFLQPPVTPGQSGPEPLLHVKLKDKHNGPRISVTNRGRRRAQIADLVVQGGDGSRQPLVKGLVGYVLPGQTMSWPLPLPIGTFQDGGEIKARINGHYAEQALPLVGIDR